MTVRNRMRKNPTFLINFIFVILVIAGAVWFFVTGHYESVAYGLNEREYYERTALLRQIIRYARLVTFGAGATMIATLFYHFIAERD